MEGSTENLPNTPPVTSTSDASSTTVAPPISSGPLAVKLAEAAKHVAEFRELEAKWISLRALRKTLQEREAELAKAIKGFAAEEAGATLEALQAAEDADGVSKQLDKLQAELKRISPALNSMRTEQPKLAKGLCATVLGSLNVAVRGMNARFEYKEEYEWCKLKLTYVTILVAALLMMYPAPWLYSTHQFILMGYHLIVTLREEVLIANGSRIRLWWRTQHYLAFLQSAVLFSWHQTQSNQDFRSQFVLFSAFIGVTQVVQFYYQSRENFRKRALGPGDTDDMMATTTDLPMTSSLVLVVAALLVAYIFQLYNAYTLALLWWNGDDWQAPVLCLVFATLGVGNTRTTLVVVRRKIRNYLLVREMRFKAIANFSEFHKLDKGSVTIDQVKNSSRGVKAWSESMPSDPHTTSPPRSPRNKKTN